MDKCTCCGRRTIHNPLYPTWGYGESDMLCGSCWNWAHRKLVQEVWSRGITLDQRYLSRTE